MPTEEKPRITLLYLVCREWERGKHLQQLRFGLTGIDNDGSPLKDDPQRIKVQVKAAG